MNNTELIPHLFRQEFSKMVAVISKTFGLQYIETAEDIVGETFLTATEHWQQKGPPPNPTAWLYAVARQKTLSYFRRNKIYEGKILPRLKADARQNAAVTAIDFSSQNIMDSQLQMMFAVCDPVIASEAQIALALRILCGFGIEEIAEAFLTSKEAISKRLTRAKEKLRTEKVSLAMPLENEVASRLDNVLHIIYLLFSEGYYASAQNKILKKELCFEALHLGLLLTRYSRTNLPKTNALVALMCFHASRLDARQNEQNEIILYDEQDELLWDEDLIQKGAFYLHQSMAGTEVSAYHLEAGIAYWHCQKEDTPEKWEHILQHYNLLLQINYSPSVAINRTYALYKARGKANALPEAEKLQLTSSRFYHVLLGELYAGVNDKNALEHLTSALFLAKNEGEKKVINEKIAQLFQVE